MKQLKKLLPVLVGSLCLIIWGCSKPINPLAEGLTEEQKTQLVGLSIKQIESIENFNPENFEEKQRKHFETITEGMMEPVLKNLPNRVARITKSQTSQTLELDSETVEVKWEQRGPEMIAAAVTMVGDRSYKSKDASKTIRTQYKLPWLITVNKGVLVLRHQGISTVNL